MINYISLECTCNLGCQTIHLFHDILRRGMLSICLRPLAGPPIYLPSPTAMSVDAHCMRPSEPPQIMTPLMLRHGRLRVLQHRVGQKASLNASSLMGPSSTVDGINKNKASTTFPVPASCLDLCHTVCLIRSIVIVMV